MTYDPKARLAEILKKSPAAGPEQWQRFLDYRDEILRANEEINLTAITDPGEFLEKHYLDSLSVVELPEFLAAESLIDVGTGGGFPGVPLALYAPDKRVVLLDSLQKRMRVVQQLLDKFSISNATTIAGRAEDLGKDGGHRERYDLCVSRAVADLPVLLELCLPFVKVGGSFIAYKGALAGEEAERAEPALEALGGTIDRIITKTIPISTGMEEDSLVVVKKTEETPERYPRRPGIPTKRPLI